MKQCLVVDDSRVIRKVARRILEDLDFRCVEAGDGQEARRVGRIQDRDLPGVCDPWRDQPLRYCGWRIRTRADGFNSGARHSAGQWDFNR